MGELGEYLRTHYLDHAQFAARCAVSTDELDRLLDLALVPQPAYVVTRDGQLLSAVFGCLESDGAPAGRYFHPGCAAWVPIARQFEGLVGTRPARDALKQRFVGNFAAAFEEFMPGALGARAEAAWTDFMRGAFGVCVADPSSERSIARKEALQETLGRLTADGSKQTFTASEAITIRALIDGYARCAMPFAPQEYSRSSRRRLVDDLLPRLATAG